MIIESSLADLRQRIEDEYCHRTPNSLALHRQAQRYLPDGDTRTGSAFKPYPTYFERGEGSYLYDVDGHQVLDFTHNVTSLMPVMRIRASCKPSNNRQRTARRGLRPTHSRCTSRKFCVSVCLRWSRYASATRAPKRTCTRSSSRVRSPGATSF